MLQNKKGAAGILLLGGIAAYAWYKYSKMNEEEKTNLMGDMKEKGKKLFDEYAPPSLKDLFSKGENKSTADKFSEGQEFNA